MMGSTMLAKLAPLVILASALLVFPADGERCAFGGRCLPDEPCWPTNDQWQAGLPDVLRGIYG